MKYTIKILDSTTTEPTAIGSRHATIVMEGTAGTITASISADGENWTEQDTYEMEGTRATVPATFNCATGTLVQFETTGTFTNFEVIWEG